MIDINTISWDDLKLAKSGRTLKLIYEKIPLSFCTAALYTPFGVKSVIKNWSNFTEYTMDVSINEISENQNFKEFLEKLDEKLKELIVDNNDLFKDPINIENYNYILKENKTFPKLIRLQLPRDKNGNFESFIFDENKNKIKIDDNNIKDILCKGTTFKCIIECSKLWIYEGRIGTIWNIKQLKFSERPKQKEIIEESSVKNDVYMIDD